MSNIYSIDYKKWIAEIKQKIYSTQIKAYIAVNSALIQFYWDLGKSINEKEKVWGSKLLEQISKDLQAEFPDMKGFSVRNLKYCRNFYSFYSSVIGQQAVAQFYGVDNKQDNNPEIVQQAVGLISQQPVDHFVQQLVAQVPWGHNILIFTKSKDIKEALFYINLSKENNWGRETLALQIKTDLFNRSGKAVTNFKDTLPESLSDLAQQTLKDPYCFDFMSMTKPYVERDIENQLVKHITKFLLELGKGFAFIGQQYHLQVSVKDYYIDLLFYHTRLKCYVVIELKNTAFMPEYAGKLNFYLSAVDSLVKQEDDNPSIGILLCKDKDTVEAEFALRDIGKPIGVSEFTLIEKLPDNLKSSLPTIEEIEEELSKLD
ncbi:MAG: PDDEXK nuclease domain-containing protein [Sphingobacteriia bacterium]|nr:PDDEXK nuclease domain-containing protein [Sphingobacteriia bacterium]